MSIGNGEKKIVIAGYYGFGNTGDDAVLASLADDLRALSPDIRLTALTFEGRRTGVPTDVAALSLTDFPAVAQAIGGCDLLLLGGGGIFNSYLEYPDNLMWRRSRDLNCFGLIFGFPVLALLHSRPAMIIGAGASEIHSDFARRDIGLGVAACSAVTLRDHRSAAILRGLPPLADKEMLVTADPVFRLADRPGDLCAAVRRWNPPRPLMAVSLLNWSFRGDPERVEDEIATGLNEFFRRRGGSFLFLPFYTGRQVGDFSDDVSILRRVAERLDAAAPRLIPDRHLEPGDASAAMAGCDLALTMRLHPTVMAVKNRVPFVSLAYDEKVTGVLSEAGLADRALDPAAFDRRQLTDRLEELVSRREPERARLADAAERQARAAHGNIEAVARLLSAPYQPPPERYDPLMVNFFMSYLRRNMKFLGDPTAPARGGRDAWQARYEDWLARAIPGAPPPPPPGQTITAFDQASASGRAVDNREVMVWEYAWGRTLLAGLAEVPGAIVEFGVFQGRWLEFLESTRRELGQPREIWGFDSFQGLPAPDPDRDLGCWSRGQYAADLPTVAERLKVAERPHIRLVPGWFSESLRRPEVRAIKAVAFARIDCDLHQSAAEALDFLTGRLVDGAILVFDDWPSDLDRGETRAFAEWLPRSGLRFEFLSQNSLGHLYLRARPV